MHNPPSLSSIRATSTAQSRTVLLLPSPPVTTLLGIAPGHARFDTPLPGAEEVPLKRSQRARKETPLGGLWRQELCPKSLRKNNARSSRPQVLDGTMPSRSMPPPAVPPANSSSSSSTVAASSASSAPAAPTPAKTTHPLSKSAINGFEREGFVEQVSRFLGQDCSTLATQELESMLEAIQNCQEASHAPEEWETEDQTVVYPPEALNVGGGFRLAVMSDTPEAPPILGSKRPNANPTKAPTKRARTTDEDGENTDTEDEDDFSQPPAPPSNSVPLRFASPRVSRLSTAVRTTSGSDRPAGLPRSVTTATAGARPVGLPNSSRTSPGEVQVTVIPSSVSPNPVPPRPISVASTTASTTQTTTPSVDALGMEHVNSLLNLALDLAKKKMFDASARAQGPLSDAVNASYFRTIEDLRNRLQSGLGPVVTADQGVPSPLEPYPNLQPSTRVAPAPDILPDNEETLQAMAAAESQTRVKSKPAMRDYSGNRRQVLTSAVLDLLAYICAEGPYETKRTNLIWALEAINRVWARDLPGIPPEPFDLNALKLLSARAAWLRGLVRDRLRQLTVFMYGLHNPPLNEAQRLENEQMIARAVPIAFHCFDISQPRSRQYEHPIIQRAIATGLFYSPDSIGAVYHSYFDPMPLPTVAFILTTIQFCLEEWETGAFKAKDLRAERQYNTYCAHLRGLQQYDTVAHSRLMRFRQRWFDFAIQHSGASIVTPAHTQEFTDAADVRPDTPVNTPESSPEL
ncbi:unnamed protein product [Rhizoctonia solani]|uniref:DUF6532 domain-containing protein n=1 Tax=Rhizoctonia solani TaxID=456999 RepID=A0A8H3I457_9AGAM|nr:unnamed protein product [Rhizoctonia solani]